MPYYNSTGKRHREPHKNAYSSLYYEGYQVSPDPRHYTQRQNRVPRHRRGDRSVPDHRGRGQQASFPSRQERCNESRGDHYTKSCGYVTSEYKGRLGRSESRRTEPNVYCLGYTYKGNLVCG